MGLAADYYYCVDPKDVTSTSSDSWMRKPRHIALQDAHQGAGTGAKQCGSCEFQGKSAFTLSVHWWTKLMMCIHTCQPYASGGSKGLIRGEAEEFRKEFSHNELDTPRRVPRFGCAQAVPAEKAGARKRCLAKARC